LSDILLKNGLGGTGSISDTMWLPSDGGEFSIVATEIHYDLAISLLGLIWAGQAM
jgi:hypothetical protein